MSKEKENNENPYFILYHECRGILSGFKNSIETLRQQTKKISGNTESVVSVKRAHAETIGGAISKVQNYIDTMESALRLAEFSASPETAVMENKYPVFIHDKVRRAVSMAKTSGKHKSLKVVEDIEAIDKKIYIYPVFNSIIWILVDNAVKYAPRDSQILLSCKYLSDKCLIRIENIGPELKADEKDMVLTRGFRGENAKSMDVLGQGNGLAFVKHVTDIHGFKLVINAGAHGAFDMAGVPHGLFAVEIECS